MKILRGSFLILILSLVLTSCWTPGPTPPVNTNNNPPAKAFVIAIPTYPGFGIPYLAENKGFFKGMNVQLVRMDDSAAINAGMERGDIDACFTSVDSFVLLAAANIRAKAVLMSDESKGADGIVVKKNIKDLAGLKGKKVAANLGWPGHFFLLYNLKKAGISFNDVKITNLDADKAGAAFVSGTLDAAVTWEPWLSKATSAGNGTILVSTATLPGVILDVMVVRDDSLTNKQAEVQAFVNGYYQALQAYNQDKAGASAIMANALGLKPEDFTAMAQGFRFIEAAEANTLLASNGSVSSLFQSASDIWAEAKVIDRPVQPGDRTSNSFVDAFVKK
jgi:NitT/TauT family transport system substrate-binding protein